VKGNSPRKIMLTPIVLSSLRIVVYTAAQALEPQQLWLHCSNALQKPRGWILFPAGQSVELRLPPLRHHSSQLKLSHSPPCFPLSPAPERCDGDRNAVHLVRDCSPTSRTRSEEKGCVTSLYITDIYTEATMRSLVQYCTRHKSQVIHR
jgi:hypothetical protein